MEVYEEGKGFLLVILVVRCYGSYSLSDGLVHWERQSSGGGDRT